MQPLKNSALVLAIVIFTLAPTGAPASEYRAPYSEGYKSVECDPYPEMWRNEADLVLDGAAGLSECVAEATYDPDLGHLGASSKITSPEGGSRPGFGYAEVSGHLSRLIEITEEADSVPIQMNVQIHEAKVQEQTLLEENMDPVGHTSGATIFLRAFVERYDPYCYCYGTAGVQLLTTSFGPEEIVDQTVQLDFALSACDPHTRVPVPVGQYRASIQVFVTARLGGYWSIPDSGWVAASIDATLTSILVNEGTPGTPNLICI